MMPCIVLREYDMRHEEYAANDGLSSKIRVTIEDVARRTEIGCFINAKPGACSFAKPLVSC